MLPLVIDVDSNYVSGTISVVALLLGGILAREGARLRRVLLSSHVKGGGSVVVRPPPFVESIASHVARNHYRLEYAIYFLLLLAEWGMVGFTRFSGPFKEVFVVTGPYAVGNPGWDLGYAFPPGANVAVQSSDEVLLSQCQEVGTDIFGKPSLITKPAYLTTSLASRLVQCGESPTHSAPLKEEAIGHDMTWRMNTTVRHTDIANISIPFVDGVEVLLGGLTLDYLQISDHSAYVDALIGSFDEEFEGVEIWNSSAEVTRARALFTPGSDSGGLTVSVATIETRGETVHLLSCDEDSVEDTKEGPGVHCPGELLLHFWKKV